MVVARLILVVDLVENRVHFLTVKGLDRLFDVPLGHLTVEEKRGKGVAMVIEGGVQGPQPELRLGDDDPSRLDLVGKEIGQPVHVDDGDGG